MRFRGVALVVLVAGAALAFALPAGVITGESDHRAALLAQGR